MIASPKLDPSCTTKGFASSSVCFSCTKSGGRSLMIYGLWTLSFFFFIWDSVTISFFFIYTAARQEVCVCVCVCLCVCGTVEQMVERW